MSIFSSLCQSQNIKLHAFLWVTSLSILIGTIVLLVSTSTTNNNRDSDNSNEKKTVLFSSKLEVDNHHFGGVKSHSGIFSSASSSSSKKQQKKEVSCQANGINSQFASISVCEADDEDDSNNKNNNNSKNSDDEMTTTKKHYLEFHVRIPSNIVFDTLLSKSPIEWMNEISSNWMLVAGTAIIAALVSLMILKE